MSEDSKRSHTGKLQINQFAFLRSRSFWSVAIVVILLLITIGTSLYFRTATYRLDIANDWAISNIKDQYVQQASQQIKQQFPTLPDANIKTQADKQWTDFYNQNKDQINLNVIALGTQLKSLFQFDAGSPGQTYPQTYVLEMDPYLWWHQAVNYADHGSVCDNGSAYISGTGWPGGSCHDPKRVAPIGTTEHLSLHVLLEAWAINIVHFFNKNIDSLSIVFFFPALLGTISVIPAFFIGRKVAGNMGGFISAMIIAMHPVLLNRTIAGFADTDGYNYLFPLLIVWFLFEAFEAKDWRSRITFSALAGIIIGLFAFAWSGWFFMFFLTIICLLALVIYRVAVSFKRRANKNFWASILPTLQIIGVFILFSFIVTTLLINAGAFFAAFLQPFSEASNLQAATSSADLIGWPNILTTVAELNIPSVSDIISNLGGAFLVAFAAFGMFVSLINPKKLNWASVSAAAGALIYYIVLMIKGISLSSTPFLILFALPLVIAILYIFIKDLDTDLRFAIFLMGWLLASLFAATRGVRFLLLGIAPFAIAFGIAIGWIYIAIVHALNREIKKPILISVTTGLILCIIIFNPFASYSIMNQANQDSRQNLPNMNDAWWNALQEIKQNTPTNTIITSWWDFGHWFRNIAERGVTFDGGSQNPEPGHLVGKILLTNNETVAIGTLRMLDCSQNEAYHVALDAYDVVPAKDLIDQIVTLTKAQAQARLAQTNLSAADQADILEKTHCVPPPAVFITSGDMIGKSGVWGHFGNWNFPRAIAYDYVHDLPQAEAMAKLKELNYSDAEATQLYFQIKALKSDSEANTWIASWPSYITQNWVSCTADGQQITCPMYLGLQQTSQGVIAIDSVSFNSTDPQNASIVLGVYTNAGRAGGNNVAPVKTVFADVDTKTMTTTTQESAQGSNFGVLIRKQTANNQTAYSAIIADPLQVDSMFTQLYFLNGVFLKDFTIRTQNNEPGGSPIIVWNVEWPAD